MPLINKCSGIKYGAGIICMKSFIYALLVITTGKTDIGK
jgi:hypothetical protein